MEATQRLPATQGEITNFTAYVAGVVVLTLGRMAFGCVVAGLEPHLASFIALRDEAEGRTGPRRSQSYIDHLLA